LTLRFFCIALAIGLFFLIFKLAMIRFSYDPNHKDRTNDKIYNNGTEEFASTVVLISLDGFRPDYLERGVTPNINQFGKKNRKTIIMYCADYQSIVS
jgi:predicted AlkP superfamily pyrophosphatase or phosphodiesterase